MFFYLTVIEKYLTTIEKYLPTIENYLTVIEINFLENLKVASGALNAELLNAAVGYEVGECVFVGGKETGIDGGGNQYAAMGEDGCAMAGLLAQVVEERGHAAVELWKTFAVGGGLVHEVVVPFLQVRVADFVEELHLPIAHVHFLESRVEDDFCGVAAWWVGGRELLHAVFGQHAGSGERGAIDAVEGHERVQIAQGLGSFLKKSVGYGHVGPSVTSATGNTYRGVANHDEIHGS